MNAKFPSLSAAALPVLMMAALLVFHASFALAGQVLTASRNRKWNYRALARVPEKARAWPNPLENDPDAVAAGRKLFEQHCAECHGTKAEGTKRAPSVLQPRVQQAPPGAIFWILTNGVVRRGMPDWSKLPEPQRWQIVRFIESFRASGDS